MIVKSFVLRFFVVALSEAGLKVDRFVVRESSPFEMDCSPEHRNVTRVRWEYISSNKSRHETIYDSQSREILKSGFEVSCQPDQKFISTCTLKLLHARKEDSGYYVCSVGDEAQLSSNLLKFIVEIELVIRGPKYDTVVVSEGEQVILQCEHNIKNLTRARWSHVSTKGVVTYQLYYMDWTKAYYYNYQGLCEPHSLSCNLKILEAKKESAGKYICMVGESQEFEDKYGLDEMTYFIEIQLVVGELKCNDGMNKDLTLIGENDCYGIKADVLNLKCSFNYFGNINYNLLHLKWIEKYKFNSLEKKLNSSLINHEVKDETKEISIQTNLSVAYEMQNSIFQCILNDTLVKLCQWHGFKTQYVKHSTNNYLSTYSNDLHTIKCSANKSENVHCSYYWVHEIGGAMVQNPYAILPVENMNSPGNYTCIAKCHLGMHECIIKAMEVEVLRRPEAQISNDAQYFHRSVALGLSFASICIFCVIAIVVLYLSQSRIANAEPIREKGETDSPSKPSESTGTEMMEWLLTNDSNISPPYLNSTDSSLPPFSVEYPEHWFRKVEAYFIMHGIEDELKKYAHLVQILPYEVSADVQDLIHKIPASAPYTELKDAVINRCKKSDDNKLGGQFYSSY